MDEDADALGLSSLSGAHQVLIPKICQKLKDSGMNDIVVFAGGIIPDKDHDNLFNSGVRAIFGPGTYSHAIIDFLSEANDRKIKHLPIGVGEDKGWRWS
jgi:methylmalonyl-CoA mutase C-terminal domain/subunit